VRARVTESHFSRYVRLSSGFPRKIRSLSSSDSASESECQAARCRDGPLDRGRGGRRSGSSGVRGCKDRPDGTAAANILSAKDWASCLGCRAHNSSWECQTVWSSRAASSMSCQRAGKTRARWRARPSKIGELCALIAALTFLVPSVAYAADPEVLVAHRGVAGGETGGAEHPGELDPGVAVGDRQLRQYRRPGCAERRRRR
jgi:hypothetical protein